MMKPLRLLMHSLILVCLVICLCACSTEPAVQTQPVTTTAVQAKTVRFLVNGSVYAEQTVAVGECPVAVTPSIPGLTIQPWTDLQGNAADPSVIAVHTDTDYIAVAYPELCNHVPYLFIGEDGLSRPDDPMLAEELALALQVLASEDAKPYLPKIPAENAIVSRNYIRNTLTHFFPQDVIDQALPVSEVSTLSRSEFAVAMNQLLNRGGSETVSVPAQSQIPTDLFLEHTGSFDMLEAILPHETAADGTTWSAIQLPTAHEPGFVNIGGWLYYVQEDHQFLRDGRVGKLYFGEDGRFTSGDETLDTYVAAVLDQLITENLEMTQLELLRQCQIYCRDTFKYLRRDAYMLGDTGWEIKDAKDMFEKGRGNCYGFAAAFWALARGLGYEAYAISGTCLVDEQPHSWVAIEFDGETFFFDPEWEWAYHDRGVFDKDMFMLSLGEASWWGYKWIQYW